MTTLELLQRILQNSSDVQRRSSRKTTGWGKPKFLFPFPAEMLEEVITIFNSNEVQQSYGCTFGVSSIALNANLVEYLSERCKRHVNTPNALLCTAILFIRKHPGSLLHEFMMMHQLIDTLTSPTHKASMIERERAILKSILQVQKLLEDTYHESNTRVTRIQQALQLMSAEEIEFKHRTAALLALETYRIASASLNRDIGEFLVPAHDRKNFKFLCELSSLENLSASVEMTSSESKGTDSFFINTAHLQLQSVSITLNETIKTTVTISQPKQLPLHWNTFFKRLANPKESRDPLTLMTDIVKVNDSIVQDIWFDVLSKYCLTVTHINAAPSNYEIIYNILRANSAWPQGAVEPTFPVDEAEVVVPAEPFMVDDGDAPRQNLGVIPEGNELEESFMSTDLNLHNLRGGKKSDAGGSDSSLSDAESSSGRAARTAQGVISMPAYGEVAFQPGKNDFVTRFMRCIAHYQAQAQAQAQNGEESTGALRSLINMTLAWRKEAKKLGLLAPAPQAMATLRRLKKEGATISFDEVYQPLCVVLCAMVFATRKTNLKDNSEHLRPYLQNAGAILQQFILLGSHPTLPLLQTLTHPYSVDSYRLDSNSPYEWEKYYRKKDLETDAKVLEQRRELEVGCVYVLMKYLAEKGKGSSSIEEQWLIILATSKYVAKNANTPFYNAIRLLAMIEDEDSVFLVNLQLAPSQAMELCGTLYQRLKGFLDYDISRLTPQAAILHQRLWSLVDTLKPQATLSSGDAGDEEKSQSQASLGTYKTHSTVNSKMSSVSRSSVRSFAQKQEEQVILAKGLFDAVWISFCDPQKPLYDKKVVFILKHYQAVYQKTDLDKVKSQALLHRAFGWLSALPSTSNYGFLLSGHRATSVASSTYTDFLNQCIKPSSTITPILFAQYCLFQVGKQMKSYEIDFIMQNLEHLYLYRDTLIVLSNQEAHLSSDTLSMRSRIEAELELMEKVAPSPGGDHANSAISLIYPAWDKQLQTLEAKGDAITVAEVAPHYNMSHYSSNKKRIVFATPTRALLVPSKTNPAVEEMKALNLSERISRLADKANPVAKEAKAKAAAEAKKKWF